jgi:hypothetical protein
MIPKHVNFENQGDAKWIVLPFGQSGYSIPLRAVLLEDQRAREWLGK